MTYHVEYRLYQFGEIKSIDVTAKSKAEAYRKALFEMIPELEQDNAYSAWVASVTYQNGNHREFNTFEGNPY